MGVSHLIGHTGGSTTEFSSTTFNGGPLRSRRFAIIGDNASYAGDMIYNARFNTLPVDGASGLMSDWPWKSELIHRGECGADNTITVKVSPNNSTYAMGAVLLNYDIETAGAGGAGSAGAGEQALTGYQLLFNAGGGSLTLSRFGAGTHELATAYLDRWPNTTYGGEAGANPVTSGPYKGWNYRNSFPAGGSLSTGGDFTVAVRYAYDTPTKTTTISYEARAADGVDLSPGVWDETVVLTGADSLPTGGSFGVMGTNYHTSSMILSTDFDIAGFSMYCVH